MPRAGDWVVLVDGQPAELVQLVTLVPGKEWRAELLLNRSDAMVLKRAIDKAKQF